MKKAIRTVAAFSIVFALLITACKNNAGSEKPADEALTTEQLIKKGEYLVSIMGCNDCHSPKEMGQNGPSLVEGLILSGYPAERPLKKVAKNVIDEGWVLMNSDNTAAAGPWGVSFAANITSDQTGIGNWTEENFKRALKEGKYKGLENSRMLLPPMPWQNYNVISDDDIKAVYSYLLSTRPVSNLVPAAINAEDIK
jgi:mono/diheme cytochrome c family protein